MLAGSSVGSVVCSIIATRTQEELQQLFTDAAAFEEFLPDMTFFRRDGAPAAGFSAPRGRVCVRVVCLAAMPPVSWMLCVYFAPSVSAV